MARSTTLLSKFGIIALIAGVICSGCMQPELDQNVPRKPHSITGPKKGGGADMDLLPAPPGMQTGSK